MAPECGRRRERGATLELGAASGLRSARDEGGEADGGRMDKKREREEGGKGEEKRKIKKRKKEKKKK
jgi:hypothetical protein